MTRSHHLTAATLVTALAAAVLSVLPLPARAEPQVVRLPKVEVVGQRVAPAPAAPSAVVQLPRVEIVVSRRAGDVIANKAQAGERSRSQRG